MGRLSVPISQEQHSRRIRSLFSSADGLALSSCKVGRIPPNEYRFPVQLVPRLVAVCVLEKKVAFPQEAYPDESSLQTGGQEGMEVILTPCREPLSYAWGSPSIPLPRLAPGIRHRRRELRAEPSASTNARRRRQRWLHEALVHPQPICSSPSSPLRNLQRALRFGFLVILEAFAVRILAWWLFSPSLRKNGLTLKKKHVNANYINN